MRIAPRTDHMLLALAAAALGYVLRGDGSARGESDGIEQAPDPIIEVDGIGRITVFNQAAEQISGYDRSEVLGRHFTSVKILALPSYPLALKNFALAVAGIDTPPAELSIQTKDGRLLMVEGNARALRRLGVMQAMQVVFRDTTERHEAAAALEAAKWDAERERRQFLSLAESMGSGLLLADPTGTVAFANSRLTDFSGVSPELTMGRPLSVLARVMKRRLEDPRRFAAELADAQARLAERPVFDIEVIAEPRQVYEIATFPVVDVWPDGAGFGALVRDVTAARELDFRKTEFVGIASHELRTPLTGILGFAQLLEERVGLDDEAQAWASRIADEAQRLSAIADDLLNVSRIETGELVLDLAEVGLDVLVREVCAGMSARASATAHVLDTSEVSGLVMRVDAGKLREVLVNLIDNAMKYSPDGGRVSISLVTSASEVRIAVSDEGIGMSEAELPQVFERFRRIDRADTATIRGAGLGLYIVNAFIQSMGGELDVESEAGRGSTFTVTLPRAASEHVSSGAAA